MDMLYRIVFIDVCIDIYVTMTSDLYGTCSSANVIVMSRTNSNLPYGTQQGRNCNPSNSQRALADHADIVYSICNISLCIYRIYVEGVNGQTDTKAMRMRMT